VFQLHVLNSYTTILLTKLNFFDSFMTAQNCPFPHLPLPLPSDTMPLYSHQHSEKYTNTLKLYDKLNFHYRSINCYCQARCMVTKYNINHSIITKHKKTAKDTTLSTTMLLICYQKLFCPKQLCNKKVFSDNDFLRWKSDINVI